MVLDLEKIRDVLSGPIDARVYDEKKTNLAAVLIMICEREPHLIMTERPKTMQHHAGEISFPGGIWKKDDADLMATALRETREELGVQIPTEQVIGQLKSVTTLNSGFTISPFITIQEKTPLLRPNSEIESVLKIPMIQLLNTMADDLDPHHRSIEEMHTFTFENHLIWGASARMLGQIFRVLSAKNLL